MLVFYVELICIVLVSSHDRTGISTADKVGTPRLYDSNAKAKATQEPCNISARGVHKMHVRESASESAQQMPMLLFIMHF